MSQFSIPANRPPTTDKREYRSERRPAQKAQTRERILQNALTLFAEVGYNAASVREIADRSGVTHGSIRLHFGSKDELWRHGIDFLFTRFRRHMRGTESQRADSNALPFSGQDAFAAFIHRYVEYCATHPEHLRIMMQESLHDSERLQWMAERYIAPAHAVLRIGLKQAIDAGVLPDTSVVSLIYILTSASQSIFALGAEARHIYGIDVFEPARIREHAQAICVVLLRSNHQAVKNRAPDTRADRLTL